MKRAGAEATTTTRRSRVRWVLPGLTLVIVIGLAVTAVVYDGASPKDGPPINIDARKMAVTKARLNQVVSRLDGITVPSTKATGASVRGCTVDSGDLFQPAAGAGWKTSKPGQGDAMEAAAERLKTDGWSVKGDLSSGEREISMTSREGWTATGHLFSYEDLPEEPPLVSVDVHIEGAAPCTR